MIVNLLIIFVIHLFLLHQVFMIIILIIFYKLIIIILFINNIHPFISPAEMMSINLWWIILAQPKNLYWSLKTGIAITLS